MVDLLGAYLVINNLSDNDISISKHRNEQFIAEIEHFLKDLVALSSINVLTLLCFILTSKVIAFDALLIVHNYFVPPFNMDV